MNAITVNRLLFGSVWLATVLATVGCSLAPTYLKPNVSMPPAYKEERVQEPRTALSAAEAGSWKTAEPSEEIARGDWWTVFKDPTLNDLEAQASSANQNLAAATARLKEARALNVAARAGLFPTLDAGIGPTRQKVSGASQGVPNSANVPAQTLWRAQAGISYEVDMFGRVANTVEAAKDDMQQSEALFRSVHLALQADVAQNYFALREYDAEAKVFADAVALREQASKLVQQRYDLGEISELDLFRATSELASARSEGMTVQRLRATSEHSLAVLLGKMPAEFSIASNPLIAVDLRIPAGLPSSLLERRPDIAAAERAMAAANARIGVAKAAFFPSLTLTGSGGFESDSLGSLFQWSSKTFLLGPLTGTALNLPIFDGGKRKGDLANARAVYEENVANYRQQVLLAFQEVEDGLSDLRIFEDQTSTQTQAVDASTRAAQLSRAQYNEGAVNYLDVIDAERTVLQNRRTAGQLQGLQAASTINLIRALGGGWGDVLPVKQALKVSQK